jgi:putative glycosyltransferase (TIGR04348 family)
MSKRKAQVVIVTPALANANNGNWQTARRWASFLAPSTPVRLVKDWPDAHAADDTVMIALHARRSAASINAWARLRGSETLAVVLTGTDLYRDIESDASAQRSLQLAGQLVVLQALGKLALPVDVQAKSRVIFQSTTSRQSVPKSVRHLRAVMVGHLREEKSPTTLYAAARLLGEAEGIRIDHIGDALDPALGKAARATMAACPHYRWLGPQAHEATRRRIQRAHVLIHCSRMEGGAHVVMEAVASGTPVLASTIDGNIGMLGNDYRGYFPWNDAEALVALLRECRRNLAQNENFLAQLTRQCAERAVLFQPATERNAVRQLVVDLSKDIIHA